MTVCELNCQSIYSLFRAVLTHFLFIPFLADVGFRNKGVGVSDLSVCPSPELGLLYKN